MTRWLVFLDEGCRWLHLGDDGVVARGSDPAAIPRDGPAAVPVTAIVSAAAVVIHWVDLPALAPAQAQAAARLLASDVCGGAMAAAHVALGAPDDGLSRPLALVERSVMHGWRDTLAAAGLVADRIVPLPLLLPLLLPLPDAAAGTPARLVVGDMVHVRGHRLAFSAEPALAAAMLAGASAIAVDAATFEAGLATALARVPLDLQQGEFARTSPSTLDHRQWRRIAMMLAAIGALWIATQATALLRDGLAADRIEQQAVDAARAVLPRGTAIDAPRAQVAAHAARLGAGGQGFAALAAPLLTLIRDRPSVMLQSLRYAADTGLVAVVVTPSPDDGAAVARLTGPGQAVSIGTARTDNGTTVVDVTVRPQ